MGLKPIIPGLHRIKHDSAQPTKVEITVPAGDELEVSEDVAAQLRVASTHFVDPDSVDVPPRQLVKNESGEVVGWSDGSEFTAADAETVGLPAAEPEPDEDATVTADEVRAPEELPAAPKKAPPKKAPPKRPTKA
jgi:hypothetical protein